MLVGDDCVHQKSLLSCITGKPYAQVKLSK